MLSRANRIKKLHKYASKASSKKAKGLNWDAAEAEIKVSDEEVSKDAILSQIAISPLFSEADIASMHAIRIEDRFRKALNTNEAAFLEMGAFLTEKVEKLSLIGDYLVSEATKPGDIAISYSIEFSNLDSIKAEFNRLDQAQEKRHQDAAEAQAAEVEEKGEFGHGYMTNDIVHDFGDGWSVVYVPAIGEGPSYKGDPWKSNDRTVEGNLNGLCLGSEMGLYQTNNEGKVYSIRDPSNKPRATVRILSDELQEVKGKSNETPDADGAVHADEWFRSYNDLEYEDNYDYKLFPPLNAEDAKAKFEEDEYSPYLDRWVAHWFRKGIPELDADVLDKIRFNNVLIIDSGLEKKYKELVQPVAKYWAERYLLGEGSKKKNLLDLTNPIVNKPEPWKTYKKEVWMQQAAKKMFNENFDRALSLGLHQIPQFVAYGKSQAANLAKEKPWNFISGGLQKVYTKEGRPAALHYAKNREDDFIYLNLQKLYPEEGLFLARKIRKENTYRFFEKKFQDTYPEEGILAVKARIESYGDYWGLPNISSFLPVIAEKAPEILLRRTTDSSYLEEAYPEVMNIARQNQKLAGLSKWLNKNCFKKEANKITLLCK